VKFSYARRAVHRSPRRIFSRFFVSSEFFSSLDGPIAAVKFEFQLESLPLNLNSKFSILACTRLYAHVRMCDEATNFKLPFSAPCPDSRLPPPLALPSPSPSFSLSLSIPLRCASIRRINTLLGSYTIFSPRCGPRNSANRFVNIQRRKLPMEHPLSFLLARSALRRVALRLSNVRIANESHELASPSLIFASK